MNKFVKDRVIKAANMIVNEKSTLKEAGEKLGYSQATIYNDVTKRLAELNIGMANQVREVLNTNKKQKLINSKNKGETKLLPGQ